MPTIEQKPTGQHAMTPEEYLRQNFEPTDRLAVVVIHRKEGKAYAHRALSRGEDPQEVTRAISGHPPRSYDNGEQYARAVVEETLAKLSRSKAQDASAAAQVYQHTQQLALGVSR